MMLKNYDLSKEKPLPKELTLEELKSRYTEHLTVGELRKKLENYPDNAKVLIERVEDVYYETHSWSVVLKKDENYYRAVEDNERLTNGTYASKEEYPKLDVDKYRPETEEELKRYMAQYHPAWGIVGYGDDKENLYLALHY